MDAKSPAEAVNFGHSNFHDMAQFRIVHWAKYSLEVSENDSLLPLFWQVLFQLYFVRMKGDGEYFGYKFLETNQKKRGKQPSLKEQLASRALELVKHFRAQTEVHSEDAQNPRRNELVGRCTRLADFFEGANVWLEAPSPDEVLANDTSPACVHRLLQIFTKPVFIDEDTGSKENKPFFVRENLWYDLVDLHSLYLEMKQSSEVWNAHLSTPTNSTLQTEKRKMSELRRAHIMSFDQLNQIMPRPELVEIEMSIPNIDVKGCLLNRNFSGGASGGIPPFASITSKLFLQARHHAESVSHHAALDSQILEHLPHLYKKEARVRKEEKIVEKYTYMFEFRFEESVFNEEAYQSILQLRDQSSLNKLFAEKSRGRAEDALRTGVFVSNLSIEQVVQGLCAANSDHSLHAQDAHVIHEAGLQWFWKFVSAENKEVRDYPPSKRVLWSAIQQLGESFLKFDVSQTQQVLNSILEDTERIPLMAPLFNPNNSPNHLVGFYASICEAPSSTFDWMELFQILKRFDFAGWLETNPEPEERTKVLTLASSVMRRLDWGAGEAGADQSPVFHFHRKLISDIIKHDFDSHFVLGIRLLVGAGAPNHETLLGKGALQPPVWDDLLGLEDRYWESIDFQKASVACNIIGGHLKTLSPDVVPSPDMGFSSEDPLLDLWAQLGLLSRFAYLIDILISKICRKVMSQTVGTLDVISIWKCMECMFDPLLATPKASAHASKKIVDCFVRSTERIHQACRVYESSDCGIEANRDAFHKPTQDLFTRVWRFFFMRASAMRDGTLLQDFSLGVSGLSWEDWAMDEYSIAGIERIARDYPAGHPMLVAVREMLPRLDWGRMESMLCFDASNETAVGEFYLSLMCVFTQIMFKELPVPKKYANFVRARVPELAWHRLSVDQYATMLSRTGGLVNTPVEQGSNQSNATGVSTRESRALLLMRLIRGATALLSASSNVWYESTARDARAELVRALERMGHYLVFLRSALGSLSPLLANPSAVETGTGQSESRALPFAPSSYILLYFEALEEVKAAIGSFALSGPNHSQWMAFGECPAAVKVFQEVFQCLNISGVPLVRPSPPRHEVESTANVLLRQIDNVLTSLGVMPTNAENVTHSSECVLQVTTLNSVNRKIGPNKNKGFVWKDAWARIAPTMVAAASAHKNTDSSELITPDNYKANFVQDAPRSILVTGAGVGALIWLFLCSTPHLAPLKLLALSRVLRDPASLAWAVEESLNGWALAPKFNQLGWTPVLDSITFAFQNWSPEALDNWFASCVEQGSTLTLFVFSIWRITQGNAPTESLEESVLTSVASWLSNAALRVPKENPEILMPLVSLAFYLLVHGARSVPASTKSKLAREISNRILKLGEDSQRGGGLLSVVWRNRSPYPPRFRFCMRSMSVYLRVNTKRSSGILRLSSETASFPPLSRKSKSMLSSLASLSKQKDYIPLENLISWTHAFITAPNHTLSDCNEFLHGLCTQAFADSPWLQMCLVNQRKIANRFAGDENYVPSPQPFSAGTPTTL